MKTVSDANWASPVGPRIWRSARSHAANDEPLRAAEIYTDGELARIAGAGFTGVWLFCQLYDLMNSSVFPELNRARSDERIASIQTVIERARKHGIGVWLYFNDPVGIDIDHSFWRTHAALKGVEKWHQYSLCTSTSNVQGFFRDAVQSVFARLHGVEGVILITACESLTHCWSKRNTRRGDPPPECPRCREREPADVVLELLKVWSDVAASVSEGKPAVTMNSPLAHARGCKPFRILAWNWEWAYWYEDPQAEIATRLPGGVELLVDLEIGGTRPWGDRTNYIGEYSLGYVGPSQRFVATREAVRAQSTPVHAKIQINNTHEMCSVPNLPLMHNLHGKFKAMVEQEVAGFMGCWNIGSEFTINTFALKLFMRDPGRFLNQRLFLETLAREYLGLTQTGAVIRAWAAFCESFNHYPFTVRMLYFGPHNDAPARSLSLRFEGKPVGSSYTPGVLGDDLSKCLEASPHDRDPFTLDQVIDAFTRMSDHWEKGLVDYEVALRNEDARRENVVHRHRGEELRCAQMIGIELRSVLHQFCFHRRRQQILLKQRLVPPCRLLPDSELLRLMRDEVANVEGALPLVEADPRLGFHQEFQGYKYNGPMIREKLRSMRAELADARPKS